MTVVSLVREKFHSDDLALRKVQLTLECAKFDAAGYNLVTDQCFLFKAGYDNIDDWDDANVRFADGFQLTFHRSPDLSYGGNNSHK